MSLALVVSLFRRKATLDIKAWDDLSETIVPKELEASVSMEHEEQEFPKLTPSGLDPMELPVPANFDAVTGEIAERINARTPEGVSHA